MAVTGEIQVPQKYIGKMSDPDVIKAKGEGVCHTRSPGCRRRSMKKQLEGRMCMTLSKVCKHFNMAGEESSNIGCNATSLGGKLELLRKATWRS